MIDCPISWAQTKSGDRARLCAQDDGRGRRVDFIIGAESTAADAGHGPLDAGGRRVGPGLTGKS